MLTEGDVLYHGSYAAITHIDLLACASGKDFGRGFYLTSDYDQARRFIRTSLRKAVSIGDAEPNQQHGYVSSFVVGSLDTILAYDFDTASHEWLRYVALNRRPDLSTVLIDCFPHGLISADVVIGKIANDTTNRVITTYLNGLYGEVGSARAEEIAISLLLPDRLKDQYCFRSERSLARLSPLEVVAHDI